MIKRKLLRILQLVTNVHRIHHIRYAWGWTFRPLPWAYFPPWQYRDTMYRYGWKRVKQSEFHDCTSTGRY